ncbi:MAG: alpha/beta hydrolase [Prevotella sp.]|nr:alpha/beta hydrolase [Prevotella sp.]
MRTKMIILFLSLFVCIGISANGGIDKQIFTYSVKDGNTLQLDKYSLKNETVNEAKPCIIFMFGGGFANGKRDDNYYVEYFNKLVNKGYIVVSIDYRLGMKNAGLQTDLMRSVVTLNNSISMAVEDLFDATLFVIEHADEWGIDKNVIIANGSSAGAISVLQGAYNISNKTKLAQVLPGDFNYAGVISFAGAIFSMDGDLKWKDAPAPIQMFHGDADSNVPYDKIEMYNIGFYGSKHIAEQFDSLNYPYFFHKIEDAAHEIANDPMVDNLDEINIFIDRLVLDKKQLMINTVVKQIGKPIMKKDFQIEDYIKANSGN